MYSVKQCNINHITIFKRKKEETKEKKEKKKKESTQLFIILNFNVLQNFSKKCVLKYALLYFKYNLLSKTASSLKIKRKS